MCIYCQKRRNMIETDSVVQQRKSLLKKGLTIYVFCVIDVYIEGHL